MRLSVRMVHVLLGVTLALSGSGCAGQTAPNRAVAPTTQTQGLEPRGGTMHLTSPAFSDGGRLPARYATTSVAGGRNVSIPYGWSGAPDTTRSFALVLVDESPVAHRWMHWAVVDIPSSVTSLPEGASGTSAIPAGARELTGTRGAVGYSGPQPPPGTGEHPYVATVYALDAETLDVPSQPTAEQFEAVVRSHMLASAQLTGLFGQ